MCRYLAHIFPDQKMLKVCLFLHHCVASVQASQALCCYVITAPAHCSYLEPKLAVGHNKAGPVVTMRTCQIFNAHTAQYMHITAAPSCCTDKGAALQIMNARRKLRDVCSELLRQVRQQMATSNGAAPAGRLERGVAPGSFLHHLATAKHHVSVRNGDDFTDTEILQQVRLLHVCLCTVHDYNFSQACTLCSMSYPHNSSSSPKHKAVQRTASRYASVFSTLRV